MTDRNRRFADKVIVITGAGSGIGRTTALAFAREGGSVVIGDINETDGAETARQIQESGGNAKVVRCDVRDAEDVEALIARAVADFGAGGAFGFDPPHRDRLPALAGLEAVEARLCDPYYQLPRRAR